MVRQEGPKCCSPGHDWLPSWATSLSPVEGSSRIDALQRVLCGAAAGTVLEDAEATSSWYSLGLRKVVLGLAVATAGERLPVRPLLSNKLQQPMNHSFNLS